MFELRAEYDVMNRQKIQRLQQALDAIDNQQLSPEPDQATKSEHSNHYHQGNKDDKSRRLADYRNSLVSAISETLAHHYPSNR